MDTLDFAELQRIDDEADVAILREPRAVVLVGNLVSVTHAVLDDRAVAANVEDGRSLAGQIFRQVKIRRDVEARQRLEVQFQIGWIPWISPSCSVSMMRQM